MSNILNVFLCIIVGIILFIAIVYSIESAAAIASFPNFAQDVNLATAHRYLAFTSSILLIVVAALIIGIICLFIWGAELIPTFGSSIIDLVFVIVILAAIAAGVIASIAAFDISQSPAVNTDNNIKEAYNKAVIAAVASLGALGFIFFVIVAIWWHRSSTARKAQETRNASLERRRINQQHRLQLQQQQTFLENQHLKELQAKDLAHKSQLNSALSNVSVQEKRIMRQANKADPSKDLTTKLVNITSKRGASIRNLAIKELPTLEEAA